MKKILPIALLVGAIFTSDASAKKPQIWMPAFSTSDLFTPIKTEEFLTGDQSVYVSQDFGVSIVITKLNPHFSIYSDKKQGQWELKYGDKKRYGYKIDSRYDETQWDMPKREPNNNYKTFSNDNATFKISDKEKAVVNRLSGDKLKATFIKGKKRKSVVLTKVLSLPIYKIFLTQSWEYETDRTDYVWYLIEDKIRMKEFKNTDKTDYFWYVIETGYPDKMSMKEFKNNAKEFFKSVNDDDHDRYRGPFEGYWKVREIMYVYKDMVAMSDKYIYDTGGTQHPSYEYEAYINKKKIYAKDVIADKQGFINVIRQMLFKEYGEGGCSMLGTDSMHDIKGETPVAIVGDKFYINSWSMGVTFSNACAESRYLELNYEDIKPYLTDWIKEYFKKD